MWGEGLKLDFNVKIKRKDQMETSHDIKIIGQNNLPLTAKTGETLRFLDRFPTLILNFLC